ncbi:DUF4232 domain-containing protein [Actinomyces polynesiensis]|uniref:DUF4232 domain-containing protein n=1 Tax=Actinomyces polynesiensis TaxID=1325934 RepID=UPI0009E42593|nr:DUF4232 domain-containing protein [Actinomyces polynesiensis]
MDSHPSDQAPAPTRTPALWWTVLVVAALVALVAWWATGRGDAGSGSDQSRSTGAASPTTVASPDAPQSVGEPSEGELGSGWDQATVSPVPEPSGLDADQRSALLRLGATAQQSDGSCSADDVAFLLRGFDVAMGHRYSHLMVTNTSSHTCTVQGYPGIGGYGDWGSTFLWTAEQRNLTGSGTPGEDEQPLITLAPGGIATADLEWTGELAGAGAERLWAFAVQLTQGQTPALFVPPGEDPLEDSSTWNSSQGDGDPSLAEAYEQLESLDIGMLTTVEIGAWHKTT